MLKEFATAHFGDKPDYSGFDFDNWTKRDLATHLTNAREHKKADTLKKRTEIQQTHGLKYSELINLPHFDIVRYHVIDPVHNIFLGIAKHAFKTWKELEMLTLIHYQIIQERID